MKQKYHTRYDRNETGLSQYIFIARDDRKLLVFLLKVFPLEVEAHLESLLPCLEAPFKLLIRNASQGSCHVLFDFLNPFEMLSLENTFDLLE